MRPFKNIPHNCQTVSPSPLVRSVQMKTFSLVGKVVDNTEGAMVPQPPSISIFHSTYMSTLYTARISRYQVGNMDHSLEIFSGQVNSTWIDFRNIEFNMTHQGERLAKLYDASKYVIWSSKWVSLTGRQDHCSTSCNLFITNRNDASGFRECKWKMYTLGARGIELFCI